MNSSSPLVRHLVKSKAFGADGFRLIDVGCSGGIHEAWREFGSALTAYCFDPQSDEIARLRKEEDFATVEYHAAFVGLDESHEFKKRREKELAETPSYFVPYHEDFLKRLSYYQAAGLSAKFAEQSNPIGETLADRTVSIDGFVEKSEIHGIDFIKIDTDGSDLEVLVSCEEAIRARGVLGVFIETPFRGAAASTSSCFHNIDRWLRERGFQLFDLEIFRYSRGALPFPFLYDIRGPSVRGQVDWGEALYLLDVAAPDYARIREEQPTVEQLFKLIAIQDIFGLPDCAAELIQVSRKRLADVTDPDVLLDFLTPSFEGLETKYKPYIEQFRNQTQDFFPGPSGRTIPGNMADWQTWINLQHENRLLRAKLNTITNSRMWRLLNFLRGMLGRPTVN